MQIDNQRLFNIKEAAQYLGISEHSLRKKIQTKQISYENGLVRWEGRIFFDKKKVDEFIDKLNG